MAEENHHEVLIEHFKVDWCSEAHEGVPPERYRAIKQEIVREFAEQGHEVQIVEGGRPVMTNWQPIETAPKNNVNVLIGALCSEAWRPTPFWRCTVARYMYGESQMVNVIDMIGFGRDSRPISEGRWWILESPGSFAENTEADFDPTRWMPLPEPPA